MTTNIRYDWRKHKDGENQKLIDITKEVCKDGEQIFIGIAKGIKTIGYAGGFAQMHLEQMYNQFNNQHCKR